MLRKRAAGQRNRRVAIMGLGRTQCLPRAPTDVSGAGAGTLLSSRRPKRALDGKLHRKLLRTDSDGSI